MHGVRSSTAAAGGRGKAQGHQDQGYWLQHVRSSQVRGQAPIVPPLDRNNRS
jgi:hypothetical protein